jgi:ABC-type Fe3+/spermidine/putrescine transport system ATPase subunit/nucleotide-binding universal stress UspA family protein
MSIVLTDLSKRFGNVLVVNNLSVQIPDGELFVLLGASGSGKSTVLRMIAGLTRPDHGTIELNKKDVTTLPPQARGTGFVFQNYSLFRHMTVSENIEFGLRIRRVSASQRRQRLDELLDLVGLAGLGNRFAHQLSGGQQQRVAIARALAYQPSVLLLDEPFGALDVKIRSQLRRTLKDIQQRLKVTTILVTHDQEEAFELADRIGVINRGNLVEVDTPEALYHRPRTEFAASFIGGKNVLIGRVEDGVIELGSGKLPVPQDFAEHFTRVRILFRPETVLLQTEPFAKNGDVFELGQGRVIERMFVGSFQRIRLEVQRPRGIRPYVPQTFGERTMQIEALQPSEINGTNKVNVGDMLWVGFKQYHILETFWPKLLLCTDETHATEAVPDFGLFIAEKASSHATILCVADSNDEVAQTRARLEKVRQAWLERVPSLDVKVRKGSTKEEIFFETQEGDYEFVVVGKKERPLKGMTALGNTIRMILNQVRVPVAIVQVPKLSISNMLICSAVGEPGKADVRVGGRLARLLGASTTVLHVIDDVTEDQRRRTEVHLEQALSTLESFGVKAESKIGKAPFVEYILNEATSGNYDLIVIGAPGPESAERLYWHDAVTEIVNGTTIPVLIVPMTE